MRSPRTNFSSSLAGAIYMSEKRRNRDKNSSWERKNVKTGRNPHNSQLRTVAILSRRYDENEECLHAYSAWGVRALQNVWERLSTSKIKEKRRSRGKKQRLWLGKTSTNPGTVKRYQVSLSICLLYKRIDSLLLCVCLSNRSRKTSKCGKNISDTLAWDSCVTPTVVVEGGGTPCHLGL